jgi:hypothetical protein
MEEKTSIQLYNDTYYLLTSLARGKEELENSPSGLPDFEDLKKTYQILFKEVERIIDKNLTIFRSLIIYEFYSADEQQLFNKLCDSEFERGIEWGRVVSCIAFIIHWVRQGLRERTTLIHLVAEYFSKNLLDWFLKNGWWRGLRRSFPETRRALSLIMWGFCLGIASSILITRRV